MAAQQTLLSQTDTLEELIHGLEAQETVVDKFVAVKPKLTEKNEYEKKEKGFSANFISMLIRDAAVYGGLLTEQEEYAFGEKMDDARKAFIRAAATVPAFIKKIANYYDKESGASLEDHQFAPKKHVSDKKGGVTRMRKKIAISCLCASDLEQKDNQSIVQLEESYVELYLKRPVQLKFIKWAEQQNLENSGVSENLCRKALKQMHLAYQDLSDTQDHLMNRNIRLLPYIAKKIRTKAQPIADLVQDGSFGMMIATDKWDHTCGVKYSTYVKTWILESMKRADLSQGFLIKRGRTEKARLDAIARKFNNGDSLTFDEEILHLQSSSPVSLSEPVTEDGDPLVEFLSFPESDKGRSPLFIKKAQMAFAKFSKKLTDRDVHVLNKRLFCDRSWTLQQVADKFHLSRERIRQIEENLMDRMRNDISCRNAFEEISINPLPPLVPTEPKDTQKKRSKTTQQALPK